MIRFYLIVVGAIATGVGFLYTSQISHPFLAGSLSAFGAFISYCFYRLDGRVKNLVKLGEDALKVQQERLRYLLHAPTFEICKIADDVRDKNGKRKYWYPYTYGENFRLMFVVTILFFIFMAAVCFVSACEN